MKSNIFRDLDKMSCCECGYKYIYGCVFVHPSLCGHLGGQTEQSAVSITNMNRRFLLSFPSISQHEAAWKL